MATARPTSPTGATVPPSATLAGTTSPGSNVSRATGVHFAVNGTDPVAPLVGAPVPKYKFEQKLEEADSLLLGATNSGLKEKARAAYQQASEYLNQNDVEIPVYLHSVIQARCQIGIALTYPYKSTERNSYTNLGQLSNKNVYETRDAWNDLNKREKIVIYQCLIKNYKDLLALILISDKALREDIQKKKQECETILEYFKKEAPPSSAPPVSSSVPLAPPPAATLVGEPAQKYDMEARFKVANSCTTFEEDKARRIYNEILDHLKGCSLATGFLMKARCEIALACTYPWKDPVRTKYRDLGKTTNDSVYDKIRGNSWGGLKDEEKIIVYQGLIDNYKELATYLSPEESDRKELNDKIQNCENLRDFLKQPTSSTSPAPLASPPIAPPIAPESSGPTSGGSQSSAASPPDHKPTTPPVPPPLPKPAARKASSKPAAKPAPRNVTPGPVSGSSRIGLIFGLAIIAIAASVASVVIYKRYFVKK